MTKRVLAGTIVAGLSGLILILGAGRGSAGPDKIKFPADFKKGVLYATVDRYDIKQYRELYSTPEAVNAIKAGKPIPSGTVLTLLQYKAKLDAQGNPVKDAQGRFIKGDFVAYTVMEKRTGWGTEYPAALRNGEWEYAAFNAEGKLNDKANYKACFECHKPHEQQDFVISLAKLGGTFPQSAGRAGSGPGAVNIVGFAFGPGKIKVAPGKPVTWTNADDSPHQVTIQTAPAPIRTDVLLRGQSTSVTFATPGIYQYNCGLHPQMKGTVEIGN
jgi:plastocyanin